LATRRERRFDGLEWRVTEHGAVLLEGASGWIEASIAQQVEAVIITSSCWPSMTRTLTTTCGRWSSTAGNISTCRDTQNRWVGARHAPRPR
jgi:hypothetical protein